MFCILSITELAQGMKDYNKGQNKHIRKKSKAFDFIELLNTNYLSIKKYYNTQKGLINAVFVGGLQFMRSQYFTPEELTLIGIWSKCINHTTWSTIYKASIAKHADRTKFTKKFGNLETKIPTVADIPGSSGIKMISIGAVEGQIKGIHGYIFGIEKHKISENIQFAYQALTFNKQLINDDGSWNPSLLIKKYTKKTMSSWSQDF